MLTRKLRSFRRIGAAECLNGQFTHARVCVRANLPMMRIYFTRKRESAYNLSSLPHYDNEITPMTQVRVKTARKIDRAVSFRCAALGTHVRSFHTTAAVSSLWSPDCYMSYWRTEFCYCHFVLCTDRSKSVRPSSDLFYWHTLSVPFRRRREKSDGKERAREKANKQRKTQSRDLIRSVTNTLRSRVFLFH